MARAMAMNMEVTLMRLGFMVQ